MPTISDVAKKAGVSIATVSYVLNGRTDLVREETAERIRRAASELNYQVSPMARGLATGSSFTVAVVLSDHYMFSHPIGSQEFLGAAEEFYMSDYSLLIKPSHKDESRMNRSHTAIPQHVAGVLVLGPLTVYDHDLQEARSLGKPMVVVEDVPDEWGVTCVNADNYRAARMVTDYIVDRGHSTIGVLTQTNVSACMTRRILGHHDALVDRGIDPNGALVIDVETQDEGEVVQAVNELLDSPLKPTALITLNSALMPGMASALDARGLSVPDGLAVGCVDYAMPPNFQLPWPVVMLRTDLRHQGELAARTLVEMLRSKVTSVENRYIQPELVITQ